jgi:hypothetical protein
MSPKVGVVWTVAEPEKLRVVEAVDAATGPTRTVARSEPAISMAAAILQDRRCCTKVPHFIESAGGPAPSGVPRRRHGLGVRRAPQAHLPSSRPLELGMGDRFPK